MFNTGIGTVHPAGGSATQRTARVNTRNQGYRQQIIATRQIERQQRRTPLSVALEQSTPGPRGVRIQQRVESNLQRVADRRAQHIAIQQVHMVQDQVPNPARANRVLAGQAYQKIREVADIGRLAKLAENTQAPLQHRVGALRSLRSRYGIPVTQENFKAFRQAQQFHSFLHDGKEGDTFAVPTGQKGPGLHRVSQTYQLRKVKGELAPVAVKPNTSLSLGGIVSGHPYRQHGYSPVVNVREAISGQGNVARGFTHASVDLTNYGTHLIPEGKVGTPVRRGLTELATLPIQTPSSIYGLGSAVASAATGNTKPIRDIAKSFSEDDPIGRLVTKGDFKGFAAHPGIALVELFGGLSAANRAAGRVARGAARVPGAGPVTQFRAGKAANIRRVRGVAGAPELDTIQRYGKGYVTEGVQRARDAKAQRAYYRARGEATKARIKADRAERAGKAQIRQMVKPVQRPARVEQIHDERATRKSIARQERRRVDRPFIQPHEVKDFQKGAKYSGVLYHVTDPETAKVVAQKGLDPAKAQRGTYGLGVYSASTAEAIPGATATVKVAVRMRNPLVIDSSEAMTRLKPYRDKAVAEVGKEDLRLLSAEMTRGLQKAGYDGVVVKNAMHAAGGDYVVNFHPQDVRVVSERTAARRGGRTSAVLDRNLPPETRTVPGRTVKLTRTQQPARSLDVVAEEASRYRNLANDLAGRAELIDPDRIVTGRRTHEPGVRGAVRGALNSLRQPIGDLEAHGDLAEGITQGRQRSERGAILTQALGKRGPFNRGDKQIPNAVLKGPVSEVAGLISQGLLAPSRDAIVNEVARLADRGRTLTADKLQANERLRGALSFVAKNYSDADLRGAVRETAVRYGEVQKKVEAEADVLGTLPGSEARWAKARTWAIRHIPGAVLDAEGRVAIRTVAGGLREVAAPTERRLSLEEVEGAWQAWADRTGGLGPDEASFVSHRPNSGRGGDFNQRALPVKGVPTKSRTGAAALEGTASHGREAQLGTLSRLTVVNSAVKSFRETLTRGAIRLSNGKIIHESTRPKVLAAYRKLAYGADGRLKPGYLPESEVVAVRTNPVGGRAEQLQQTIHNTDEAGFLADGTHAVTDLITDALKGTDLEGYKGGWAVMPKDFANRLATEHAVVTAGGHPTIRAVTQAFRNTVLPFSPTWLTGNVVESAMRAAFIGAGPGSYQFETKVIAKLAEQGRHDLVERYLLSLGSGHLGSTSNFAIRATADSLKDSRLQGVMRAAHDLYEANTSGRNVARATADLVRSYNDWIMHTVNGSFETMMKRAMAGRYMREHLVLPENMGDLAAAAVEDAARGLKSSRNMTELTRYVQRAYGQYEHWSPNQRKFMLTYTPFGAWLLAATKFLFINLPVDHPGKLALIAANDSATRQWRRDNGLDMTTGQLPPFLGGSIPTPGWYARLLGVAPGSPIRIGRYTPFGFSNDPLGNIASAFIPQLPLEALAGRDFKGTELKNADGTPYDSFDKAGYFVKQLALSSIPIVGMAVRAATGKHGSVAGNIRAVLNPAEPVSRPDTSSGGGSSGGGGWSWGGSSGSSGGGSSSGGWSW